MPPTAGSAPLTSAQQRLVASEPVQRLLERYVRTFTPSWPKRTAAEIRSLAAEAVVLAARRYDPSRGVPFEAFAAPSIRGHLIRRLAREARDSSLLILCESPDIPPPQATKRSVMDAMHDTPEQGYARVAERVARRAGELIVSALLATAANPEQQLVAREQYRLALTALDAAIGKLPSRQQRFVQLYFRQRRTHREIATDMGRSERTIERLHAAVIETLARSLRRAGIDGPPPLEGRPTEQLSEPRPA